MPNPAPDLEVQQARPAPNKEVGRMVKQRAKEDAKSRETEAPAQAHSGGGGKGEDRPAAARMPRFQDHRRQAHELRQAHGSRPPSTANTSGRRKHESAVGGAPGSENQVSAQEASSRPHSSGGRILRERCDEHTADAAGVGKQGPGSRAPGAGRYPCKSQRDSGALITGQGKQQLAQAARDENQSPQVLKGDDEGEEDRVDLMSLLEKAEARGQQESASAREGETMLEEEEEMLRRRAEELERDMDALRAKKRRARLQKVEEGLREQAAQDMKDFEDALQEHLEERIRCLIRDKDAKAKACKQVVRELEDSMEKLQLLILDAKKKADAVDGTYTESVDQLRREHAQAISLKRSELHSKLAEALQKAHRDDVVA